MLHFIRFYLMFTRNHHQLQITKKQKSKYFLDLQNLPAVGVKDGKQFAVDCLENTGSQYHNQKVFFTQADFELKYKFTFKDARQFQRQHNFSQFKPGSVSSFLFVQYYGSESYSDNYFSQKIANTHFILPQGSVTYQFFSRLVSNGK